MRQADVERARVSGLAARRPGDIVELNMRRNFTKILDRALKPEPWCIDTVSYDGEVIEMAGWALAPRGRSDFLTFTVNDREFDEIKFPFRRADIAPIFWFKAGADRTGFHCRASLTRSELFKNGPAVLKCVTRKTGLPLREEFNVYYPEHAGPELPDVERRRRVWGPDPGLFVVEGFSTFKKLDLALRKTMDRTLGDFHDILDWGCGCGRVTRNFHLLPEARLVGIDIDSDNVNWCREHFNFGEYRVAPLRPPTGLAAESFDLIIGISVFSHLRELAQQEWLAELSRLARPGAVLLMSTLGNSAAARAWWTREMWDRWQAQGLMVMRGSSDLGELIGDEDYYVTTYLTEDYIRRSWKRTFEILDFIPAYISNHQDLVVMRKPDH